MRTIKHFTMVMLIMLLMYGLVSCGLFTEETCGIEGEMSMRVGTETSYYCSVNALFRGNSVMFTDSEDILLVNYFGYKFEEGVTKSEQREASRVGLIERTVNERLGIASIVNRDTSLLSEELQAKITGTRQIMVQIPYEGTGVYRQDRVFVQMYEDDELIYRYTPSNKVDNLTFNLNRFQVNGLSEEDLEKPEYKGATEEELSSIKKVYMEGRLLGSITLDGEKVNINANFKFNTIIELPESLQ